MGIEFNAQQKDAIKDIGHWYKSLSSHQVYELSGRPGTGKTTLMNYVIKEELGLQKLVLPVSGIRNLTKKDMKLNNATPKLGVDPETYDVTVDGELITCEPAKELPLAQRYFLF